jgi:mono/diheme cytochrome c family protein
MKFRGARRDEERQTIAEDYSQTVQHLIDGGGWREMPAPEDQLPDVWMPAAFFDYWSGRPSTP